jgi:hypothetical protein
MSTEVLSRTDSYIQLQPWAGDLIYTYVVNGEYDPGFYRIRARSELPAQEKIQGWKGRMVVVRHSPDKHDLSARLKSDQPGRQLGN